MLCRDVRSRQRALYFGLLDECGERTRTENQDGSFMEQVITHRGEFALTEELAGYLGTVVIAAGSDTTSQLQTVVLAPVVFPEAQRKAQAEIDHVVGEGRLLSLDDVRNFPYICTGSYQTRGFVRTFDFRSTCVFFRHTGSDHWHHPGYHIVRGNKPRYHIPRRSWRYGAYSTTQSSTTHRIVQSKSFYVQRVWSQTRHEHSRSSCFCAFWIREENMFPITPCQ